MIETKTVQAIKSQLFSEQSGTVFTILDGASVPDLPVSLAAFDPEHVCLHRGELEPDMAEVAPYLALLEREAPFTDWVLCNGWGRHWGIFGTAQADLRMLRNHFRAFLMVNHWRSNLVYFRYYDPRVLGSYLSTCDSEDLATLFGPVQCYLVEESSTSAGKLMLKGSALQKEILLLG
jgi:hypothetical protein